MQIEKKELENKFIDNMRSMRDSQLQSINEISQIDRKISYAALIEKFLTNISYVIKILINLLYY